MSMNAGSYSCVIVVRDRAAGVVTRICINTGFHAKAMYMVGDRFHTVRKATLVGLHFSIAVPFAKISVVNVDIAVSHVFQTFFDHKVSLIFNNIFTDIYPESIP